MRGLIEELCDGSYDSLSEMCGGDDYVDRLNFEQLYPFQKRAIHFLIKNYFKDRHCILDEDDGMGKTVQICFYFDTLLRQTRRNHDQHLIIICSNPTRVTHWHYHLVNWVTIKLTILHIDNVDKLKSNDDDDDDVVGGIVYLIDMKAVKLIDDLLLMTMNSSCDKNKKLLIVFDGSCEILNDHLRLLKSSLFAQNRFLSSSFNYLFIFLTNSKLMKASKRNELRWHLQFINDEKMRQQLHRKSFRVDAAAPTECICDINNLLWFPWQQVYLRISWINNKQYYPLVNQQEYKKRLEIWKTEFRFEQQNKHNDWNEKKRLEESKKHENHYKTNNNNNSMIDVKDDKNQSMINIESIIIDNECNKPMIIDQLVDEQQSSNNIAIEKHDDDNNMIIDSNKINSINMASILLTNDHLIQLKPSTHIHDDDNVVNNNKRSKLIDEELNINTASSSSSSGSNERCNNNFFKDFELLLKPLKNNQTIRDNEIKRDKRLIEGIKKEEAKKSNQYVSDNNNNHQLKVDDDNDEQITEINRSFKRANNKNNFFNDFDLLLKPMINNNQLEKDKNKQKEDDLNKVNRERREEKFKLNKRNFFNDFNLLLKKNFD